MIQAVLNKQKELIDFFFENMEVKPIENLAKKLASHQGMIFFTGVGKSGFIAQKLAMTFVSIGIKALFLSPQDALHGDIGIVRSEDIVFLLSKSGNSDELLLMVRYLKSRGAETYAVVCDSNSRLSNIADETLKIPFKQELCPFNMVPTVSTSLQLLFGDVLTVSLMHEKQTTLEQFAQNHPAGKLGKVLTLKVEDVMLNKEKLPICCGQTTVLKALEILSSKGCGCVLVKGSDECLKGIFTDGDLRRSLQKYGAAVLEMFVEQVMTIGSKSCQIGCLASQALQLMESKPLVTQLPVLEGDRLIGLIRMHDLIQIGLL